jgi:hypothetical protein
MAKVLTTKGLAASLEDLIRKADKELYLISYSFKISETYIKRIKQAVEKGVIIKIVYGTNINDETLQTLKSIPNLKILHYPNLHAKIYANETKCIIGSMNFYDYSEANNTELGVLLSLASDEEAYKDALIHCREIVSEAIIDTPMMPKVIHDNYMKSNGNKTKIENTYSQKAKEGFCIRTGKKIPLNHERPLCDEAYAKWSQYSDDEYPEKFCHFTGEKSNGETCVAAPVLSKNWKKYLKATEQ